MALAVTSACAPVDEEMELIEGPAIADIQTPFEGALTCLRGKISKDVTFAVGGIPDQTGTYQNSDQGVGRFVTQGAGDIVQSALFKTGVTLINRRDMGTSALESQWGLLDLAEQRPVNFVVTGSVNSLDFIPGGGAYANVGGVGAQFRQFRILVGFDLAMTNVRTGRIVANIALRKQISADEKGFLLGRVFGDTIVDVEVGTTRREATHHALRQMLQLGTYELLTQMMPANNYRSCSEQIDERYGKVTGAMTGGGQLQNLLEKEAEKARKIEEERAAKEAAAAAAAAEAAASVSSSSPSTEPLTQSTEPLDKPETPDPVVGSADAAKTKPTANAPVSTVASAVKKVDHCGEGSEPGQPGCKAEGET